MLHHFKKTNQLMYRKGLIHLTGCALHTLASTEYILIHNTFIHSADALILSAKRRRTSVLSSQEYKMAYHQDKEIFDLESKRVILIIINYRTTTSIVTVIR